MGVHFPNISLQIFEKFNVINKIKKFDIKLLLITRHNENKTKNTFYMACNFLTKMEKNKGKNLELSSDSEILYNNITSISKLPMIEINRFSIDYLKKFLRSCYDKINHKEDLNSLYSPITCFKKSSNIVDIYYFYLNLKKSYKDTLDVIII